MSPRLVKASRFNFCDDEFEKLFDKAKRSMSPFQIRIVEKNIGGEYTKADQAAEAYNESCNHIHEGLLNTISRETKKKHPNRQDEIKCLLGIVSLLKDS